MQPNLKPVGAPPPEQDEPVLQVIENFVPAALHQAAWEACSGSRWCFGHGSHEGEGPRFWKMDLDGDRTFDAIWEHARAQCEALAGSPLRVIRQYANGHTYGLGGQAHLDDVQPGTYTLLYYPNPEWKDGWDGETVYYDQTGEIALAVRPRPNRAVFFDSRILHAGRAPSRLCPDLRVTVAYKLAATASPVAGAIKTVEPPQAAVSSVAAGQPAGEPAGSEKLKCEELTGLREGVTRVYRLHVAASEVENEVQNQLSGLGKTLRLPGFRPGKVPMAVLQQRYGTRTRVETVNRIAAEATHRMVPPHSVLASLNLRTGASSGDLEFDAKTTYLPDLPEFDASALSLERLDVPGEDLQAADVSAAEADALVRQHLRLQILDHLDAAFPLPLLPFLVERELTKIWNAAEAQADNLGDPAERESLRAELRSIAERRVRLGIVIAEIARRHGMEAQNPAALEDKVVDSLVTQARVQSRAATVQELRSVTGAE